MIAYGNEAFDMHEKAPSNIEVLYPMSFGTVASITYMQQFLRSFLEERTKGSRRVRSLSWPCLRMCRTVCYHADPWNRDQDEECGAD